MMLPLTIQEELLYTTMKLSAFQGTTSLGTGTGFFWRIQEGESPEKSVILLATDKHVIAGCDRLEVVCHLESKTELGHPSGAFAPISILIG